MNLLTAAGATCWIDLQACRHRRAAMSSRETLNKTPGGTGARHPLRHFPQSKRRSRAAVSDSLQVGADDGHNPRSPNGDVSPGGLSFSLLSAQPVDSRSRGVGSDAFSILESSQRTWLRFDRTVSSSSLEASSENSCLQTDPRTPPDVAFCARGAEGFEEPACKASRASGQRAFLRYPDGRLEISG